MGVGFVIVLYEEVPVWRQVPLFQKIVLVQYASISVKSSNIFKCDGLPKEKVVR
jgi:hypothetical protein